MVASGVCRVVLADLLGALGLTVADVALILGFYTLGGWGQKRYNSLSISLHQYGCWSVRHWHFVKNGCKKADAHLRM
eukprot:scaffold421343_cov65-Attheya_sp.AAC.2